MTRKTSPKITIEVISDSGGSIDPKLNDLYIRMVKRQLLDSSFSSEQKKYILKALRKIHWDKA